CSYTYANPSYARLLFHAPASSDLYTLSLHDALPILLMVPVTFTVPPPLVKVPIPPIVLKMPPRFTVEVASRLIVPVFIHVVPAIDRKRTRLNSSHVVFLYVVFCFDKIRPLASLLIRP